MPRGRKPKPIQQRLSEGDARKVGAHKLEEMARKEPRASRGLPECPEYLWGVARDAWIFWSEELGGMGLDCRCDAQMLEGACVNYARALEAEELISKDGLVVREPIINQKRKEIGEKMHAHPAVAIANNCWKSVRAFCSEFGLSPVSRTRLAVNKERDTTEDVLKMLMEPRKRAAGTERIQ